MAKKRSKKKNDNMISSAQKAVSQRVKQVKRAKSKLDNLIEIVAFVLGVGGFVTLACLAILWVWNESAPESYPGIVPVGDIMHWAIIAVFAASFTGWLIVNDGQDRLEKKSSRIVTVVIFGILPLICLAATIFPTFTADTAKIPRIDNEPWYPFWIFVRFYPLLLISICLWVAFKREAKPRKYFKKKRALKFLLLAAPYIVVLAFQEFSLKQGLVQSATEATLGAGGLNLAAAGLNIQLMMALMTGTRYD